MITVNDLTHLNAKRNTGCIIKCTLNIYVYDYGNIPMQSTLLSDRDPLDNMILVIAHELEAEIGFNHLSHAAHLSEAVSIHNHTSISTISR